MNRDKNRITIIADDRERKSDVIKYLLDMKSISVETRRLSIGDYIANNQLVFERKTLNDFDYRSLTAGCLSRRFGL